jgi:hypothetical protein
MLTGDDERKLWLTVIHRAMEEARGVPSFVGMSPLWVFQAQRWLTNDKLNQFKLVCHLAGLTTEQYKLLKERTRATYGLVGDSNKRLFPTEEK